MPPELNLFETIRRDFPAYAARWLWIRTKDATLTPLVLNRAQQHLHAEIERQRAETGKVRIIGLKGRQQGFSTYVEARFYWRVIHALASQAFILTHEQAATNNLFGMVERKGSESSDALGALLTARWHEWAEARREKEEKWLQRLRAFNARPKSD